MYHSVKQRLTWGLMSVLSFSINWIPLPVGFIIGLVLALRTEGTRLDRIVSSAICGGGLIVGLFIFQFGPSIDFDDNGAMGLGLKARPLGIISEFVKYNQQMKIVSTPRWVNFDVNVCPDKKGVLQRSMGQCESPVRLKRGTPFVADMFHNQLDGDFLLEGNVAAPLGTRRLSVYFSANNGSHIVSRMSPEQLMADVRPAFAKDVLDGNVKNGMKMVEVKLSKGEPETKLRGNGSEVCSVIFIYHKDSVYCFAGEQDVLSKTMNPVVEQKHALEILPKIKATFPDYGAISHSFDWMSMSLQIQFVTLKRNTMGEQKAVEEASKILALAGNLYNGNMPNLSVYYGNGGQVTDTTTNLKAKNKILE